MIFHFSNRVKKNHRDFLDSALFFTTFGVVMASLGSYHWFFNLFDQFWIIYLFVSMILLINYKITRAKLLLIVSMINFIICLIVFLQVDRHPFFEINSNFKIYYHNINSSNSSLNDLADYMFKEKAELVTLLEVTPEIEKYIGKKLHNYPNIFSLSRDDNFGFYILSKHKFQIEEIYERFDVPVYIKLFINEFNLQVYLLHLPPPLWKEAWLVQKEALSTIADEIGKMNSRSFLILGDFNATIYSRQFQDFYQKIHPNFYSNELLFQGTWPAYLPKIIGLPIDHVLSNRKFKIEIGSAKGSDHRSIIIKMK